MDNLLARYKGCLFGLACGDAVGTTVEFKPRGSFQPVQEMIGGGPFNLRPGEWTDDTSMALCLAESLLKCEGFDPKDQMDRYLNWYHDGYLSSNGRFIDIGNTVRRALDRYQITGRPYSGSTDPMTAGNGSIMRLAPVPMYYRSNFQDLVFYSAASSRTTHAAIEAVDACRLFGLQIGMALMGMPKEKIFFGPFNEWIAVNDLTESIRAIAKGKFVNKNESEIIGSGYVVESLEAALACFYQTNNFRDAILYATNLGDDADTTAAVCGQIAGAYYGIEQIPSNWLDQLALRESIDDLAYRLYLKSSVTNGSQLN